LMIQHHVVGKASIEELYPIDIGDAQQDAEPSATTIGAQGARAG